MSISVDGLLVYAAERQPGAARAGDRAVSGGGRAKIGGDFVATLTQGDGLSWIAYGIFITAIPLLTVGILAHAGENELSDAVRHAGRLHD